MPYNRGERMKLTNGLSTREKRSFSGRVIAAQEAMETAEDNRDKVLADAWTRGVSIGSLQGISGLGYENVRKILKAQGLDIDAE